MNLGDIIIYSDNSASWRGIVISSYSINKLIFYNLYIYDRHNGHTNYNKISKGWPDFEFFKSKNFKLIKIK